MRFIHHDNPEPWLIELREEFRSNAFCGCYEGDMGNMWDKTVRGKEIPDYTIDYGTHSYSFVMGSGQQRLVDLIRDLLK